MLHYPNKIKIAVCGLAHEPYDDGIKQKAYQIGQYIAKHGCIIVTGATFGYPYEAAKGAFEAGGLSVGISPANGKTEHHTHYHMPFDCYDPIIYTGFGLQGRNVVIIRSSDAVIFIGGGSGTLNEFTSAYRLGKPLAVLTGSGKISDHLPIILDICSSSSPQPPLIHEADPEVLVHRMVEEAKKKIELL